MKTILILLAVITSLSAVRASELEVSIGRAEIMTVTSIGARFIAGTDTMATGKTTGTGILTAVGGFRNGSGFPTRNKVSILTFA